MAMTALAFWFFTAFVGAYMWLRVSRLGRTGRETRHSRLPDSLLFLHPLAAFGGLSAWIGYLVSEQGWLAWTAFGALVAAAAAGIVMRLKSMQPAESIVVARDDLGEAPRSSRVEYAEHELPPGVMTGHGILATVTIVLVFLEALLG